MRGAYVCRETIDLCAAAGRHTVARTNRLFGGMPSGLICAVAALESEGMAPWTMVLCDL